MAGDIVDVAWSGHIGGIERLLQAIAGTALTPDGHVHHVLFLDGSGPIGDELVEQGLATRLGLRRGYDLYKLVKLGLELRRLRPRIIHFHTFALSAHVVALVALPRAIRVYTEHSRLVLVQKPKFRLLYRLLRRTTTAFVAVSEGMQKGLLRMGVEPARIHLIPNASAMPPRTGRRGPAARPTIGVVARLEPQKRVDLFLDVLAELRRRGVDCRGLVVGDGSVRDDLLRRRDESGLAGVVEFAGEQWDVAPWLDRLDLFLLTPEAEPFGIAALEAMARGVPVVGMPCPGGLAELIERGGLLLPDREVATAADAVEAVLGSSAEQERLRARGDATVEKFSLERTIAKLDSLYRSLTGPRSR